MNLRQMALHFYFIGIVGKSLHVSLRKFDIKIKDTIDVIATSEIISYL
jgi:hypothetical protein